MTTIIVCPGIHETTLTASFVKALRQQKILEDNYLVFPTDFYPAFSSYHLLRFINQQIDESESLIFLAFSAGVVAAMGSILSLPKGRIKALIALDGWGVPLLGDFPIYRVSHDEFTHWSSALLGGGEVSFYADPAVEHLELWKSPDQVIGWRGKITDEGKELRAKTTAIVFLKDILS